MEGSQEDMKRYWMPDANAKTCYDCGEKFTLIRRRHHCRICGQIFCSKCSSEEIPGHLVSAAVRGNLRCCKYCFNHVSTYMAAPSKKTQLTNSIFASSASAKKSGHSDATTPSASGASLSAMPTDLAVVREQIFSNISSEQYEDASRLLSSESDGTYSPYSTVTSIGSLRRRSSIRFREEDLARMSYSFGSSRMNDPSKSSLVSNERSPYKTLAMKATIANASAASLPNIIERRKKVDDLEFKNHSSNHETNVREPKWVKEICPNDESIEIRTDEERESSTEVVDGPEDEAVSDDQSRLDSHGHSTTTRRQTIVSSCSTYDLEMDINLDRVSVSKSTSNNRVDASNNDVLDHNSTSTMTAQHPSSRKVSVDVGSEVSEVEFANTSMASNWEEKRDELSGTAEAVLDTLNQEYEKLYDEQLIQLLKDDNLPLVWAEVVKKLTRSIADSVRPCHDKENEDIDVRQYVKIKKILGGGSKNDSHIVRGLVFSKSVLHRRMRQNIPKPAILLLSCPIVYQNRGGDKFSTLDDVLLQENNYLQNVVAKISSYRPQVVVVDRTVARTAQDMLLDLGITLVSNVKTSVLERLAMFTGAGIVSSLDAQLGSPQLGRCENFYLRTYGLKTLMFFDGCQPEIGCTVLLRGAGVRELAKIKDVTQFMIFVDYNWRLERSLLMDMFAMPRAPRSKANSLKTELLTPTEGPEDMAEVFEALPDEAQDKVDGLRGDHALLSRVESCTVEDNSDPLRSMALVRERATSTSLSLSCTPKSLEDGHTMSVTSSPGRSSSSMGDIFRALLPQLVLTCSPFIELGLPYLVSIGERSPLHKYLPQESHFWSKRFKLLEKDKHGQTSLAERTTLHVDHMVVHVEVSPSSPGAILAASLKAKHPFMMRDLKYPLKRSPMTEALVADFRARGGLLPKQPQPRNDLRKTTSETLKMSNAENSPDMGIRDALVPKSHQRLPVLYCNYSHSSEASFCIDPSLIMMLFYRDNDIALGAYLEKYCFKPTAACGHSGCTAPQVEHIRKFCHGNGAVHITLKQLKVDIEIAQQNIITWSWCSLCKTSWPFVALSPDSWSLSFAKYLQLKVLGKDYVRWPGALDVPTCEHSLFQDHFQYFAHKHIVACFKFQPIICREISLPNPKVRLRAEAMSLFELREELKCVTVRGFDLLSLVIERLCALKEDAMGTKYEQIVRDMLATELNDRKNFREKIEQTQVDLCTHPDVFSRIRIQDSLVNHVRLIAQIAQEWNSQLLDFVATKRKEEKNATKTSSLSVVSVPATLAQPASRTSLVSDNDTQSMSNVSLGRHTSQVDEEDESVLNRSSSNFTTVPDEIGRPGSPVDESMDGAFPGDEDLLKDHQDVLHRAISAIDHLNLNEEDFKSESELSGHIHILASSASNSSLSSITGDVTPGIKAGLSKAGFLTSGDNETFAVYHNSCTTLSETMEDHFCPSIEQLAPNSSAGASRKVTESYGNSLSATDATRNSMSNLQKAKTEQPKTMKTMFNQLLSNSSGLEIESPFPASDHYLLPVKERLPVIVKDSDPGSLIAYAMTTPEYEKQLAELMRTTAMSPVVTKKKQAFVASADSEATPTNPVVNLDTSNSLSTASVQSNTNAPLSKQVSSGSGRDGPVSSGATNSATAAGGPSPHTDIQFQDSNTKFYCCVYFADSFRRLRNLVLDLRTKSDGVSAGHGSSGGTPGGPSFVQSAEDMYIRSLSNCVPWAARGGKSGSMFCKTTDDRFILKEMSRTEWQSFINLSKFYFDYIENSIVESRPTLLAKILGVYKISYKNSATNSASKMYLLVMENLFYNRNISQKFDLKGSIRNRLADMTTKDDVVLLDENLLRMIRDSPLYIRPHSKQLLCQAIDNDSQFLATYSVMDYSLLVGIDDDRRELCVGIIDYIRNFTWDKKVEMALKLLPQVTSQNKKMPTIISPEMYRERFCEKLSQYFLAVPDAWYGLDSGGHRDGSGAEAPGDNLANKEL